MPPEMIDKCVSTDNDFTIQVGDFDSECVGSPQWKVLQLRNLLIELVNSKGISNYDKKYSHALHRSSVDSSSDSSSIDLSKAKKKRHEPEQEREHGHHHHHHRHHHHHHHSHVCKERRRAKQTRAQQARQVRASSVVKVRRWSEELPPEPPELVLERAPSPETARAVAGAPTIQGEFTIERQPPDLEALDLAQGDALQPQHPLYIEVEIEGKERDAEVVEEPEIVILPERRRRRRRRRKRRRVERERGPSKIDPEDLPKRARWTIIITAGLLLMTCMLLVGITLRMAPIIDQIVLTQNEELLNSITRQDSSPPNKTSS